MSEGDGGVVDVDVGEVELGGLDDDDDPSCRGLLSLLQEDSAAARRKGGDTSTAAAPPGAPASPTATADENTDPLAAFLAAATTDADDEARAAAERSAAEAVEADEEVRRIGSERQSWSDGAARRKAARDAELATLPQRTCADGLPDAAPPRAVPRSRAANAEDADAVLADLAFAQRSGFFGETAEAREEMAALLGQEEGAAAAGGGGRALARVATPPGLKGAREARRRLPPLPPRGGSHDADAKEQATQAWRRRQVLRGAAEYRGLTGEAAYGDCAAEGEGEEEEDEGEGEEAGGGGAVRSAAEPAAAALAAAWQAVAARQAEAEAAEEAEDEAAVAATEGAAAGGGGAAAVRLPWECDELGTADRVSRACLRYRRVWGRAAQPAATRGQLLSCRRRLRLQRQDDGRPSCLCFCAACVGARLQTTCYTWGAAPRAYHYSLPAGWVRVPRQELSGEEDEGGEGEAGAEGAAAWRREWHVCFACLLLPAAAGPAPARRAFARAWLSVCLRTGRLARPRPLLRARNAAMRAAGGGSDDDGEAAGVAATSLLADGDEARCEVVVSPSLAYGAALRAARGGDAGDGDGEAAVAVQLAVHPDAYVAAASRLTRGGDGGSGGGEGGGEGGGGDGYADCAHVPPGSVHWELEDADGRGGRERAAGGGWEGGGEGGFVCERARVTMLWLR